LACATSCWISIDQGREGRHSSAAQGRLPARQHHEQAETAAVSVFFVRILIFFDGRYRGAGRLQRRHSTVRRGTQRTDLLTKVRDLKRQPSASSHTSS
jgi:hypothetical protein